MVADIKALMAPIVAARGGRDLVLLMNPAQKLGMSWVAAPNGDFVFASADNGQVREYHRDRVDHGAGDAG